MADPTLTNSNSGVSTTATTACGFGFTATTGRILVLVIQGDDYKTGNPSGWTLSTNCAFELWQGVYKFWKVSDGTETTVSYTLAAAARSAWEVLEFNNIETTASLDTSNGAATNTAANPSRDSASVTPSSGRRFVISSIFANLPSDDITGIGSWTNSYVEQKEILHNGANPRQAIATAVLALDGNGSTATTTNATFTSAASPPSLFNASIVLVFKVAGASQSNAPRAMHHYRQRR